MTASPENTEFNPLAESPADDASSELVHNLLRLVQIARYRKKTILQAVGLAIVVGTVYYVLAPRYYDAAAKLLIIERNADQLTSVGDQTGKDNTMATHRELVVSPVVVQNAIEHLLPEHRIDLQDKAPGNWVKVISARLSATTTRNTNLIEVRCRSLSPEAAAAIVSAVIQSYLQFIEQTHKGSANDVIAVLTQEREQLRQGLAVKQAELQAFRQKVGQLAIRSDGNIVEPMIQRALKLNDALMEAQQQRLGLQASLASVQIAIRNGEDMQQYLSSLQEMVGQQILMSALGLSPQDMTLIKDQEQKLLDVRAERQSLAPFYGPAHPKVIEINQRIQQIEQYLANYRASTGERFASFGSQDLGPVIEHMLQQAMAQAWQREQQLQASFEVARAEAAHQSGDIAQLQMLEREVARLESLHDVLFEKIANVDIRQLQAPVQATVVQEPLPDEVPDSPQLRLVAMLSLLGGLAVGCLVAYVQDVLDDRFGSPETMAAQLRVPVLAMVRRMELLEGSGLDSIHAHVKSNDVETEAFRTLRTALTLSAEGTNRILISSAEPSDGKTTVAANLAVSFAQAGKKTLVIDADLRKPGMSSLMGLKGQPGVADILYGGAAPASEAARLVRKTALPGLDVLPSGSRRPNPAELLSGPGLAELLAWADSCYDQVLVDCPPVLAVSDAQIVGRLVDGAILVVQPLKNHRRLVVRACESFSGTGTNVLGVVANNLTPESSRGYGYGYGYGYEYGYGYGYGHDSEDTASDADDRPDNGKASDAASAKSKHTPHKPLRAA